MLSYPPFDISEWNCLSDDLYIFEFATELERLEKAVKDVETQIEQTKIAKESSIPAAGEEALDMAAALLRECNETERREAMAPMLAEMKRSMIPPRSLISHHQRRRAVEGLIRLYGKFDAETFKADVAYFAKQSGDDCDYGAELSKLTGKLGHARRQLNQHWKNWKKCFTVPPLFWRGFRVTAVVDNVEEREKETALVGEKVIRNFLEDWKYRAPLFEVPVDVNGIAIHSMPTRRRVMWEKAYEALGLQKLRKRLAFKARLSHDREPVANTTQTGAPSAIFSNLTGDGNGSAK